MTMRIWKPLSCLCALTTATVVCMMSAVEASMTVGGCLLPKDRLAAISARGDCPDFTGEQTCPDEIKPCDSGCDGNTYNPQEDCEAACTACNNGCQTSCQAAAELACGEDQDCINAILAACVPVCQGLCPCNCDELDDENFQMCVHTIEKEFTYKNGNKIPQTVTNQAATSMYENIPTLTAHCFDVTNCGTTCTYKGGSIKAYTCDIGDTNNSEPPYKVPNPQMPATDGNCGDEE